MVIWSGTGLTVTLVNSGADCTPALLVAMIWSWIVTGAAPGARLTVNGPIDALGVGFGLRIVGTPTAPAFVCVHLKVHGSRLAGSVHEAVKGPNARPD